MKHVSNGTKLIHTALSMTVIGLSLATMNDIELMGRLKKENGFNTWISYANANAMRKKGTY